MTVNIEQTGVLRSRLDNVLANVTSLFKEVHGESLNVGDSTPDGQIIGILAEVFNSLEEQCQNVFDNFNPNSSTGLSLDELVKLNGTRRIPKTPSNTVLQFIATPTFPVTYSPPRYSYSDAAHTEDEYVVMRPFSQESAGTNLIYAESTSFDTGLLIEGTIDHSPDTALSIGTAEQLHATNAGREEETDAELRGRRNLESSHEGDSSTDIIYIAVSEVFNVKQVKVLENSGFANDPTEIPLSSVAVIVLPEVVLTGAEEIEWTIEVGSAILHSKTGGAPLDDSSFPLRAGQQCRSGTSGNTHIAHFYLAEPTTVLIELNISVLDGFPTSGEDDIKSAIVEYVNDNINSNLFNRYGLASLIYSTEFNYPAHKVPGHTINSLVIGLTEPGKSVNDIQLNHNQIISVLLENVEVTIS